MKICWDNLENLRLNRNGNFNKGTTTYVGKDACKICGHPYLMDKYQPTESCSLSCARCGSGNSMYGVCMFSNTNPNYKGGVKKLRIPIYETYAHKISYVEETRRYPKNLNWLQVRCTYCDKWFIPITDSVQKRVKSLDDRGSGEGRLYCSGGCKKACSIYGQYKYPKGFKPSTSREVQPELRKLVLKRDNYTCQKCGKNIEDVELHCHHIEGVEQNPIESADIDNCIILCKYCHKEIHSEKGCRPYDLRCKGGI